MFSGRTTPGNRGEPSGNSGMSSPTSPSVRGAAAGRHRGRYRLLTTLGVRRRGGEPRGGGRTPPSRAAHLGDSASAREWLLLAPPHPRGSAPPGVPGPARPPPPPGTPHPSGPAPP